ncbi:MAG: ThuA domain-containing protein [Verrucomicrobiales bacterium]|nr:ThuA domain-containing protein [Verrucomicrobiales bacterium]
MKKVYLFLLLCFGGSLFSADKKVIFISGKPSHGPGNHEHHAGNILLADRLNEADLGIEAIVLPDVGYPVDPSVLDDADSIVFFCTGHQGHVVNPHLKSFDEIMKRGTGVVMIHWATEAAIGMQAKKFLDWMGGYCGLNWSVNPHWSPTFTTFPDHPVARGLTPFSINDEWYYHMRFVPGLEGVTPILSAVPGPETLKRPDGPRSGNPEVRRAVAAGESQHVAWCYDRPDGEGRGFGFTGAHNHSSWRNDNFRKVVLNAIAWTAHAEIPENGVLSATPDDDELKQNLDPKAPPKMKMPPPPPKIPELEQARQSEIREMDFNIALSKLFATLSTLEDDASRATILNGILLGLDGQRDLAPPDSWHSLKHQLNHSKNGNVKKYTSQLAQIFGDEEANREAFAALNNRNETTANRKKALASLVAQQYQELPTALEKLLDEPALRIDAIRAYSTFDSASAPRILLDRYPRYHLEEQRAVIETLATRKSYAEALLTALDKNEIRREAIPAYVDRSLQSLLGSKYTDKYATKAIPTDQDAEIEKYKQLVTPDKLAKANASQGRTIYERTCMACHKMYNTGGIVGPDLTGSNRADLNYLFLNILYPGFDIPDAYKMHLVTRTNGQLLAGSIKEENDQKIVLNTVGQLTTIPKSDIEKRETSPVSMMPAGLLQTLSEDDIINLVKYLQTKQQVDLPQ